VMCPDKKLEWFNHNPDWRAEDRDLVNEVVRKRWSETYALAASPTHDLPSVPSHGEARGRWASSFQRASTPTSASNPDSIEAYLSAPIMSGGPLVYWEQARRTRPRLARMALDFLSTPASSVDAERAFSGGRLQVNHLQHGISSQSFKALVALGSWYNRQGPEVGNSSGGCPDRSEG